MASDEELMRRVDAHRAAQFESSIEAHSAAGMRQHEAELLAQDPVLAILKRVPPVAARMLELSTREKQDWRSFQLRAAPVIRFFRRNWEPLPEVTGIKEVDARGEKNWRWATITSRLLQEQTEAPSQGTGAVRVGWQVRTHGRVKPYPESNYKIPDGYKFSTGLLDIYRVAEQPYSGITVVDRKYRLLPYDREMWLYKDEDWKYTSDHEEDADNQSFSTVRVNEDSTVRADPTVQKAQDEIRFVLGAAEAELGISNHG